MDNNNEKTLDYYNRNADNYVTTTISVDFSSVQEKFINALKADAVILDFGCGSGRDTKYFLDKGYHVEAIDGSEELCIRASEYTGITVKHMYFQELDEKERYDGIWACSSILHLNKEDLKKVLKKMAAALKKTGVIYTSFKYGDFEGERDNRYYTDFTEETFREYLKDIKELTITEEWITGDVLPGRGDKRWLNLLMQKTE